MRTSLLAALTLAVAAVAAQAKLPPLSDEAKAKAAEAAAKTAHGNKVADFQLCKAMDKVASGYRDGAKKAGKTVGKPTETPACADPGPFVYTAAAAPAAGAAPAAAVAAPAAAPGKAAAAAPAKK